MENDFNPTTQLPTSKSFYTTIEDALVGNIGGGSISNRSGNISVRSTTYVSAREEDDGKIPSEVTSLLRNSERHIRNPNTSAKNRLDGTVPISQATADGARHRRSNSRLQHCPNPSGSGTLIQAFLSQRIRRGISLTGKNLPDICEYEKRKKMIPNNTKSKVTPKSSVWNLGQDNQCTRLSFPGSKANRSQENKYINPEHHQRNHSRLGDEEKVVHVMMNGNRRYYDDENRTGTGWKVRVSVNSRKGFNVSLAKAGAAALRARHPNPSYKYADASSEGDPFIVSEREYFNSIGDLASERSIGEKKYRKRQRSYRSYMMDDVSFRPSSIRDFYRKAAEEKYDPFQKEPVPTRGKNVNFCVFNGNEDADTNRSMDFTVSRWSARSQPTTFRLDSASGSRPSTYGPWKSNKIQTYPEIEEINLQGRAKPVLKKNKNK